MAKRLSASEYIEGIHAGNRAILGRALTVVESTLKSDQVLAEEILGGISPARMEKGFRLGITGVPGVGKSTFIDAFGTYVADQGRKVAVLAVDPSSSLTRGSILGDKTRMERLSRDPRAFVRPSPAAGSLGGVTRSTRDTILLCEAAGFEYIIVETVGVGQSEIAVHSMVDFFLLLMLTGAGDELQGIKKGIMEMADGIAINKADGDNVVPAKNKRIEYQQALHLFPKSRSGWSPQVLTCSALEENGIPEIFEMLEQYRVELSEAGWLDKKRRKQALQWMHETIRQQLEDHFYTCAPLQEALKTMEGRVEKGLMAPTLAASALIALYLDLQ